MCEKMSNEKVAVMHALGAQLIKTPITADSYSHEGIFGVANRLHKEIPNSLILDQVRLLIDSFIKVGYLTCKYSV